MFIIAQKIRGSRPGCLAGQVKVTAQTKMDTLVLQFRGWAWGLRPHLVYNLTVPQPQWLLLPFKWFARTKTLVSKYISHSDIRNVKKKLKKFVETGWLL